MIIHTMPQGSPEWMAARAGIPTASAFDRIITPKTLAESKQAGSYLAWLMAERVLGAPLETKITLPMQRGKEHEEHAVAAYELLTGLPTTAVGFITNDACTIGASPDRLVGDEGLLEIKCPEPHTHMAYFLGIEEPYGADYRCQVQGQLWITGRAWVDFLSYCPGMPNMDPVRVMRDDAFIFKLAEAVEKFSAILEAKVLRGREEGWIR
jgi:hypothetical protein